MTGAVIVATTRHAAELTALRISQLSRSREFVLTDPRVVEWDADDERSLVLAVVADEGALIATMRGSLVGSLDAVAARCGGSRPRVDVWPALLLQRAATRLDHRASGLNALLRFHLLESAHAWGIRFVLGSVVRGAPRTDTMRRMGYELVDEPSPWPGYVPFQPTVTGCLDLEIHYERAMAALRERVAPLDARFPFTADRASLRESLATL